VVAGWLYRDRGEDDSAIRAFERVLELDDENAAALGSLAELVDASRGLSYAERLVELDPDDPQAVATLEGVQATVAAAAQAEAQAEAAAQAEAEPQAVPVGDLAPDEAAPVAEDAVDQPVVEAEPVAEETVVEVQAEPAADGGGEIYTQTLAELYAKQGATDKAVEVYRQLLVDDPDNGMFLHRVAELTRGVDVVPAATEEPPTATDEAASATDDRSVVSVESLAPDPEPEVVDDGPVMPIESLAPDSVEADESGGWADLVETELAVPVEDLAPDPAETEWATPDVEPMGAVLGEEAASASDDREVVPIEALAPDDASDGQDDDPFLWMNKL
jgi:tetratricopeptide (TPR) repeat protein